VAEKGAGGRATYIAAPNIALVKYWGKRDEKLALPYNSSLSVTLDHLRTKTTVTFVPTLAEDELWLNGAVSTGAPRDAVARFLDRVRGAAGRAERARVVSENNFPTASGLASSASGFAALAGAAAAAAGLDMGDQALSQLARFGSGSASRSIFGGFVEWKAGTASDGSDCYATPLFGPDHWSELVDLVVLVADAPTKEIRSASAMQDTVRTSPEYAARQAALPRRLEEIREAIRSKDGERLFPLIMEECDEFRRVCETTVPSLDYLTGTSRRVLAIVRDANARAGRPVAGYTHDAGAHVHVFTLETQAVELQRRLRSVQGIRETKLLHPGPGGRLLETPTPRG
jgi:diphosphomevalonate decarboxylase